MDVPSIYIVKEKELALNVMQWATLPQNTEFKLKKKAHLATASTNRKESQQEQYKLFKRKKKCGNLIWGLTLTFSLYFSLK